MPKDTDGIFFGLTAAERQQLMGLAQPRHFKAKTVIFRQGQHVRNLYLVRTGCVAQFTRASRNRRATVILFKPGDAIGLVALASRPRFPQLSSFYTLIPTDVWSWDSRVLCFHELYPKLTANALNIVFDHIEAYRRRHLLLVTNDVEHRVAHALVTTAKVAGTAAEIGTELPLTNDDIASLADTTVSTATRQLKKWQEQAVLTKRRGHLVILNLAPLLALLAQMTM